MPSIDEYVAAGLYDPDGVGRGGRIELLEWLAGHGFTIEQMVAAGPGLPALANDWRTVPGRRLPRSDAVDRAGISAADFDECVRALGFSHIGGAPPGEVGITEREAAMIGAFDALGEIFSREEALAFLRVIGSAMSRIAEAGVSLFLTDVEADMLTQGHDELELAQQGYAAVGLIDEMSTQLDLVLRRHIVQASERMRLAEIEQGERHRYRYAVGFVDLVGFTEISGGMSPRELGAFIRDFEGRAYDVVNSVGARLVKLIGDEVMFVSTDAEAACLAGSALMDGFGDELDRVMPRGGLAYGDVLVRGGDYYGSIVNLAARLVDEAVPQELLVTSAVADAAGGCVFEPAGRRMVKGFADPIAVQSYVAGGT